MGTPIFIAFLKTTQNFLQVGYLIYPKSMREKYGLNLYLSLNATYTMGPDVISIRPIEIEHKQVFSNPDHSLNLNQM